MFNTVLRLFTVYFITVLFFRFVGKRQVGELQLSELVVAIFVSELATSPVTNKRITLLQGIIPVIAILLLEIFISYLSIKSPVLKRLFDARADFIIENGKINQEVLTKSRMTLEELLSELRQQGSGNISQVRYAILESNGKMSVIPKSESGGIDRALIVDGKINEDAMKKTGKNKNWLSNEIKKFGIEKIEDVLILTIDDAFGVWCQKKE